MRFPTIILLASLLPGVVGDQPSFRETLSSIPHTISFTKETLPSHVSTTTGSTLVLAGASWDGHFRAQIYPGHWQRYLQALPSSVQHGYILYDGRPIGPNSLPRGLVRAWDAWGGTAPSYELCLFKDGKEGPAQDRELINTYHSFVRNETDATAIGDFFSNRCGGVGARSGISHPEL
ncbi:uncharacterized protein EV422DRAFT_369067 [Fimicolochytrium jonesii]|uniref:uncharacterized protein n=1 Tax=Fimicolochytrium jonesii TaxID=1396493 RepID=UPI0022FE0F99|nr:uncharacterized protein EV422DRAFT_369067 [Fimicolochytrium jonesii]KAI8823765.1 hypothetical protein EV422DRAFT_369067 [Fimicolochytrium jonesii]